MNLLFQDIFTKFRVVSLKETILGGNQWKSENTKLTWTADGKSSKEKTQPANVDQNSLDSKHILLTPMQIRTFVAEITPNHT